MLEKGKLKRIKVADVLSVLGCNSFKWVDDQGLANYDGLRGCHATGPGQLLSSRAMYACLTVGCCQHSHEVCLKARQA